LYSCLARCGCNFRSESIGVSFKYLSNGLFPDVLVFDVVAATIAIAVFAILSTREALTIKLEASRVLAVAVLFLLSLVAR
jgi:hypothetical protein